MDMIACLTFSRSAWSCAARSSDRLQDTVRRSQLQALTMAVETVTIVCIMLGTGLYLVYRCHVCPWSHCLWSFAIL